MRVSRIVFRLGLAALLSAAAWANDAALTDDAFFANGNAGHFGATPTVNVGGIGGRPARLGGAAPRNCADLGKLSGIGL